MRSIGNSSASAAICEMRRFQSLSDRGRADEHGNRAIRFGDHAGVFPRPGAAAFDEASRRNAVIAAVHQPAVELELFRPAEFAQAMLERRRVVAAVARGWREPVIGSGDRERIGHLIFGDEISAANFQPVDARSCAMMSNIRS